MSFGDMLAGAMKAIARQVPLFVQAPQPDARTLRLEAI